MMARSATTQTIGDRISPEQRRAMADAVIESNYKGGSFFAPLEFKRDDADDGDRFLKPIKFKGFANTGKPDLGDDIVEPEAFNKATLNEFLKFGRQLFFMHSPYSQVGEITEAEVVTKGTRSMFGIKDGGLLVRGFVDSPVDEETGMIPDHELAKVIHFARMQVRRGRLKLLSIGWRPTKTETITAADPRRAGEQRRFRLVKSLILGEISLVTMAMSPQAMIEAEALKKAFAGMYGDDIAAALFCDESAGDVCNRIPEKVDGLDEPTLRKIFAEVSAAVVREMVASKAAGLDADGIAAAKAAKALDDGGSERVLNLVSLNQDAATGRKLNLVTLAKG
jgi:hypothetical protein